MAKSKKKTETACVPCGVEDDKYSEWRVRDAMESLMKVGEIINDPTMMKKVNKLIKEKKRAFKSVEDLKAYKNELFTKKEDEEGMEGDDD